MFHGGGVRASGNPITKQFISLAVLVGKVRDLERDELRREQ